MGIEAGLSPQSEELRILKDISYLVTLDQVKEEQWTEAVRVLVDEYRPTAFSNSGPSSVENAPPPPVENHSNSGLTPVDNAPLPVADNVLSTPPPPEQPIPSVPVSEPPVPQEGDFVRPTVSGKSMHLVEMEIKEREERQKRKRVVLKLGQEEGPEEEDDEYEEEDEDGEDKDGYSKVKTRTQPRRKRSRIVSAPVVEDSEDHEDAEDRRDGWRTFPSAMPCKRCQRMGKRCLSYEQRARGPHRLACVQCHGGKIGCNLAQERRAALSGWGQIREPMDVDSDGDHPQGKSGGERRPQKEKKLVPRGDGRITVSRRPIPYVEVNTTSESGEEAAEKGKRRRSKKQKGTEKPKGKGKENAKGRRREKRKGDENGNGNGNGKDKGKGKERERERSGSFKREEMMPKWEDDEEAAWMTSE